MTDYTTYLENLRNEVEYYSQFKAEPDNSDEWVEWEDFNWEEVE